MNPKDLIFKKNELIIQLNQEREKGNGRVVRELGSEVATLEGFIAKFYLDSGYSDKAVVNLISQASCLIDANRALEAVRVFLKALELSSLEETREWIKAAIARLGALDRKLYEFRLHTASIENNKKLRIPQVESYLAARSYFAEESGHAIVQLPVGCGKTGAMSLIPFGITSGRVLAIAPNLEIRRNLHENFDYFGSNSFLRRFEVLSNGTGPACAFLDRDANIHDCDNADIVVANIQQLAGSRTDRWLSKLSPDFFDLILIDEAHHNVADTWQKVLKHFEAAKKISFTATPLRSDGKVVEGKRIYKFPIMEAIKQGYIKDIASRKLEPVKLVFNYKDEDREIEIEEVLKLRQKNWFSRGVALSRECNENIVDASIQCFKELRENGTKHQIIAVACSIDHARSIRALYEERQLNAAVLHSELPAQEQEEILSSLKNQTLDVIVQIQMLGEGADYPHLSVAAIFRPFRHLMPYVQFVGRIMRVIEQEAPGHPDNRGFVVSHIGLNVDRWWDELRSFDEDDEAFFNDLATGDLDFMLEIKKEHSQKRRPFKADMTVIEEAISHFVHERFMPEDARVVVDDLLLAMSLRGIDIDELGVTREQLEKKLVDSNESKQRGQLQKIPVSPQRGRKSAKLRLHERVRSAAKQLLNELGISVGGFELPRNYPSTGAQSNLPSAIVLLNKEVKDFLNVDSGERGELTEEQLRHAHDNIDHIIDSVAKKIRDKLEN